MVIEVEGSLKKEKLETKKEENRNKAFMEELIKIIREKMTLQNNKIDKLTMELDMLKQNDLKGFDKKISDFDQASQGFLAKGF